MKNFARFAGQVVLLANIMITLWLPVTKIDAQGENNVVFFSWHPGGEIMAALPASGDKIEIRDRRLQVLGELSASPDEKLRTIEWSPDGNKLAISTSQYPSISRTYIWKIDTQTRSIVPALLHTFRRETNTISRSAWHPDSRYIATSRAYWVEMWDTETGQKIGEIPAHHSSTAIDDLKWNPDGDRIVSGGSDYTARIWDVTVDSPTLIDEIEFDRDGVDLTTWSPDGQSLVITVADSLTVWQWDASSKTYVLERTLSDQGHIYRILWAGDVLMVLSYRRVQESYDYLADIWDTRTWKLIQRTHRDLDLGIYPTTITPDGRKLTYIDENGILQIALIHAVPTDLLEVIAECISDTGIQTSLTARVEAGQWGALINEVEALESTKITAECAAEIVEMAQYFIENPPPE